MADAKTVLEFAREHDAKILDLRFTDLPGLWHHVSYPIEQLTVASLEEGFGIDGSSIRGWAAIHESDMLLMPDSTFHVLDPFTEVPPIPELPLFPPFPRVPGMKVMNDCQSGIPPVCGRSFRVSCGTVEEISAVVVSSRGAPVSIILICCVDCPIGNCTFNPVTPDLRVMGPRCNVAKPSLENVIRY